MAPSFRSFTWQVQAVWALLASVFKDKWTIDDYPIHASFRPVAEPLPASRWKVLPWTAGIINWTAMTGCGNTKLEALTELRKSFERFKVANRSLPRPGTKVPMEFAASDRVDQHPDLAKDFIKQVLEIDQAWISDESSLWDFHGDKSNEKLVERIRVIYGVDVSDISGGSLADILDRIAKSMVAEHLPER